MPLATIAAPALLTPPALLASDEGSGGPFDVIAGLPVHPLVVHAAVVLLPLSAIGLVALVLVPRWRRTLGWLVLGGLVVSVGAAFVAKESGEKLAARVGLPERHAQLGDLLPIMAGGLFVVAVVWFVLARRDGRAGGGDSTATRVMGVAVVLFAALNLVLVVLVGHSGAQAVWAGRIAASEASSGASASPASSASPRSSAPMGSASPTSSASRRPSGSATTSASATSAAQRTFTMADVRAHATASRCWAVIDGKVYDLTSWESAHPGGAQPILALCGRDATTAFRAQHGSQREPNDVLAGFQIGVLS